MCYLIRVFLFTRESWIIPDSLTLGFPVRALGHAVSVLPPEGLETKGQPPGQSSMFIHPIITVAITAQWTSLVGNTLCMLSHIVARKVSAAHSSTEREQLSWTLPPASLPFADLNLHPFFIKNNYHSDYNRVHWVLWVLVNYWNWW